jgi:hypothetical protein
MTLDFSIMHQSRYSLLEGLSKMRNYLRVLQLWIKLLMEPDFSGLILSHQFNQDAKVWVSSCLCVSL